MSLKLKVGNNLKFKFINEDDFILFRSGLISVLFGIEKKFVPMSSDEQVIFEQIMKIAKETKVLEETYDDENFVEFPHFENIASYFLGGVPEIPKEDLSQMLSFAKVIMRKSVQYALKTEEKVLRDSLLVFVVQWSVFVHTIETAKQMKEKIIYENG